MAGYIGKSQGVTQVDGYTRSELDGGQLDTRYYTESEVDSLLSGIASDAISEGNSSVEVVDTGTGHVAVTVDGSETARFTANGRLGIGTTSPGRTVEVYSSQPALKFNNGTNAWTIGTGGFVDGSDSLVFFDAGVGERMRIDSSGNLGIGTQSPAYKTHIVTASSGAGTVSGDKDELVVENSTHSGITTLAGNAYESGIFFGHTSDVRAGEIYTKQSEALMTVGSRMSGGQLRFLSGDGTEAARIDSSANLKFNSGYGSVETAYGIRVWATIQQSPSNATKGSGGLGSYTDIGVGRIQLNLLNAMPDLNYTVLATSGWQNSDPQSAGTAVYRVSATYCRVETYDTSSEGNVDFGHTSIVLVR